MNLPARSSPISGLEGPPSVTSGQVSPISDFEGSPSETCKKWPTFASVKAPIGYDKAVIFRGFPNSPCWAILA